MKLIKRLLLGWRITLPFGERHLAIPIVLSSLLLCCCCPTAYIFGDVAVRQAGLAPTYTPRPTNTTAPTRASRSTATDWPTRALSTTETEARDIPTLQPRTVNMATTPEPRTAEPEAPTITPAVEQDASMSADSPTSAPVRVAPVPSLTDTSTPGKTPAPTQTLAPTERPAPLDPTASRNANLRAGPGTNYPTLGSVRAGQPLTIVATNSAGDWHLLANDAWIAASLVSDAPAGLPVAINIPPPPASPTAPPARSAPVIAVPPRGLPGANDSNCDCSANLYNCNDFIYSAFDAQACYLRCMELVGRDIHDLDRDHDGSACEWEY